MAREGSLSACGGNVPVSSLRACLMHVEEAEWMDLPQNRMGSEPLIGIMMYAHLDIYIILR